MSSAYFFSSLKIGVCMFISVFYGTFYFLRKNVAGSYTHSFKSLFICFCLRLHYNGKNLHFKVYHWIYKSDSENFLNAAKTINLTYIHSICISKQYNGFCNHTNIKILKTNHINSKPKVRQVYEIASCTYVTLYIVEKDNFVNNSF